MRPLLALFGAAAVAACSGGVSGTNASLHSSTGSTPYTIGGTVSGLTGSGLVLQNNGGNNLSVAADGSFSFTVTEVEGNVYNVSVLDQPTVPNATCVPTNAIGTVGLADVTNVTITCTAKTTTTDTIGGVVVGLAGSGLVLQNEGADSLAISTDGAFTFATPLASGTSYAVAVLSPPTNPNQTCVVTAGSGTTGASDVNNVAVACTTTTGGTETIGGTVTGLPAGSSLILEDNGRDDLMVSADGAFTFKTQVPSGAAFNVTIATISDPSGSLSCAVQNPGGVVKTVAVSTVAVVCNNDATFSLVGIQVAVATPSIAKGLTSQFTATGIYSSNSSQDLTTQVMWTSSNPAVATISTGGLAAATGLGTTTMSATLGGFSSSATLTVTGPTLVSIMVTDAAASVVKGLTDQFTATGMYTDGSTQNLTTQVTWVSNAPTVATIAANGIAVGVISGGSTMISASLGTMHSNVVTLQVTAAALKSIAISDGTAGVAKGATDQFTAVGTYTDGSQLTLTTGVTWASSAPTVASITSGGVAIGLVANSSTMVTASSGAVVSNTVNLPVTSATLKSIAIAATTAIVAKGATDAFTATGTYTDGTTMTITTAVTWRSSVPTVASIAASGLVTALIANSSTTITATSGAVVSNAVTLPVTLAALKSITIAPTTPSVAKGSTDAFTATGTYSDGTTKTITTTVTWASSAPAVATIAASGIATGLTANSTTTITASSGTMVSNAVSLMVGPPTLKSITIAPTTPSVAKGSTDAFTATGTYTDGTTKTITTAVTWKSSAPAVASIAASGIATGLTANSTTTITASSGTVVSNTVSLMVGPPTLKSITIAPTTPSVAKGSTDAFTATGTYTDGTTKTITTTVIWASSAPAVATIAASGIATGLTANSTTTITASSGTMVSNAVSLTVGPPTLKSITIAPTTPSVAKGSTDAFTATGTYTDGTTKTITTTVTWASSAPAVATIAASGIATGLTANSTTTITASSGTMVSNAVSLMVGPPTLKSITIAPTTLSVAKGSTDAFTATGTYSDRTTMRITTAVTWTSSNPAAATITAAGVATGVAAGGTMISASLGTVVSNAVTLTVTAPITISVVSATLPAGATNSLQLQVTIGGVVSDPVSIAQNNTVTALFSAATGTAYSVSVVQEPGNPPTNGFTGTICSINDQNLKMGSTVSDTVPGTNLTLTVICYNNPLGFAFVTNSTYNQVMPWLIESDGTLALWSYGVSTGQGPQAAAISGGNLYVVNKTSGDLSVFSLDANTGELTPVSGSPFNLSLTSPSSVTVGTYGADPALYITNHIDGCSDTVSAFDIAGGGKNLVAINEATNVGPFVSAATVASDADGFTYYYVADNAQQGAACNISNPIYETGITGFMINPKGQALTFLTQHADATDVLYSLTASQGYLYDGTNDGVINAYQVLADGVLSTVTAPIAFSTSTTIDAMTSAVYGGATYLYALGYDGTTASLASFYSLGGQADECYSANETCITPLVFGSTPIAGAASVTDAGTAVYLYVIGPNNIWPFKAAYNAATGFLDAPGNAMGGASLAVRGDQTSIVVEAR